MENGEFQELVIKQFGEIQNQFGKVFQKIDSLSEKVDNQGTQLKENTQILKALEHLAEVNKAEHDKMFFTMAEMSGEIKNMRKDLSTVEIMTANNWGDIAKLKSIK